MDDIDAAEWPIELVALYAATYRANVRVAYAMIGSRHEAEEIDQDSVLALARQWGSVRHPESYLRRTITNRAIAVLRRRAVAARHPVDPPPPSEDGRLVELRDALLRLPDRQRAAVVLRFVAGLDDREIASALDCRPGTARSLMSRGLAALRKEVPR